MNKKSNKNSAHVVGVSHHLSEDVTEAKESGRNHDGKESSGKKVNGRSFTIPALESKDFFNGNPALLVWLIFLGLGGSLLALYYAHIQYLPDIEWKASLIYIAIASLIGGGVGLLMSLSLFLPGLIWCVFLVCDPTLKRVFCYEEEGERRDPSVFDIFLMLGLPFGLVLLISHVVLPLGVKLYVVFAMGLLAASSVLMYFKFRALMRSKKKEALGKLTARYIVRLAPVVLLIQFMILLAYYLFDMTIDWYFWVIGFALPIVLSIPISLEFDFVMRNFETNGNKVDHKRIFKYVFWFGLSMFLGQISLLLTYILSGNPQRRDFWILTCICTFTVLLSNHVVAMLHAHHSRQAIIASTMAAFLLLAVANHYSSLPAGIMSLYGFGNETKYSIYVNGEGEKLLSTLGLSNRTCPDGTATPDKLCDVEILSALGNDYYLQVGSTRFSLPKSVLVARKTEGSK